ncbi:hypothetical protein GT348_07220 [Aristophania vespae]|uniref:Uncharacterized protein n=1 Tax=Aristophania vespae TaxID=2697033 RepID=A0A6P1NFI1_9PROT|nr:hypothetical protein [Aristophania vespae]QHI96053.1 hypothetical protein GT348_07220 [Aristophania vespae]UMM63820.1 hypothetical protein DM15PD_07970 [Aristophania vespae]
MSRKTDEKPAAPRTEMMQARLLGAAKDTELKAGTILVTCVSPGFRRAGIAHERLKIWARDELEPGQIEAMRQEPKLTLIEFV